MSERPTEIVVADWEIRELDTLAETKVFALRRRQSTSPSDPARRGEFVYLDAPDWVNVIALTAEEEVVVIEQFRHGIKEVTLEIPGGSVDPGEDPLEAGLRELREETGYVGADARLVGAVAPNPAIQNNLCHTVLVRDAAVDGPPRFEGLEEIRTSLVALADIPSLIRNGRITHALVVAAFYHLGLRDDR